MLYFVLAFVDIVLYDIQHLGALHWDMVHSGASLASIVDSRVTVRDISGVVDLGTEGMLGVMAAALVMLGILFVDPLGLPGPRRSLISQSALPLCRLGVPALLFLEPTICQSVL